MTVIEAFPATTIWDALNWQAQKEKNLMVYKGIEFNIIQGFERDVWKWTVSTDGSEAKSGQTKTKPNAVIAWRAIDLLQRSAKLPLATR
jgi:hypothetical protein